MAWTDFEADAFAAGLIGLSEEDVQARTAGAGVHLRAVHAGVSEWHTDSYHHHGVTVTFDGGVAVRAVRG